MMLSPQELLAEFFPRPDDLARLEEVPRDQVPEPYSTLLVHQNHMTVSMENFHHGPVGVEVLGLHDHGSIYCRQIILRTHRESAVVQFGIVRLHADRIDPRIVARIRAAEEPLGRILIQENVLRSVVLERLWRVTPEPPLTAIFGSRGKQVTYGRTARISVEEQPAVELLEISAPLR